MGEAGVGSEEGADGGGCVGVDSNAVGRGEGGEGVGEEEGNDVDVIILGGEAGGVVAVAGRIDTGVSQEGGNRLDVAVRGCKLQHVLSSSGFPQKPHQPLSG